MFPKDNNFLLRRTGSYSAVRITNEEFLRAKARLLKRIFESKDQICELGCGSGWNLLALRYMGFQGKLTGIDISKNGIKAVQFANKKYDLNIQTIIGDIRSSEIYSCFPVNSSTTLFTYLALEQLPVDAENVLVQLSNLAKERDVYLLESSQELFSLHYSEMLSKIYTRKRDYLTKLRFYMRKNKIKYTVSRVRYSHRIGNEIALYRISNK